MTKQTDTSHAVSDAEMEKVSGGLTESMTQALHKNRTKSSTASPALSPLCPIAIAPGGSDIGDLSGKVSSGE